MAIYSADAVSIEAKKAVQHRQPEIQEYGFGIYKSLVEAGSLSGNLADRSAELMQ